MVTIINFKERQTEDGKPFFVLEVQGGMELIKSQATGKFYATARKASIPSTFDEMTCKALIGTQMEGGIKKEECEPYEYINKETGDFLMLSHRYVYVQDGQEEAPKQPVHENFKPSIESFSKNGKHELEHA